MFLCTRDSHLDYDKNSTTDNKDKIPKYTFKFSTITLHNFCITTLLTTLRKINSAHRTLKRVLNREDSYQRGKKKNIARHIFHIHFLC